MPSDSYIGGVVVCVCVCACMRMCVCMYAYVCVHACVCVHEKSFKLLGGSWPHKSTQFDNINLAQMLFYYSLTVKELRKKHDTDDEFVRAILGQ